MKIVAKALILDKQGKALVLRRSGTHPRFAHHLDFPGGELEQDEDPLEATTREIKEETSLIIETSELELGFEMKLPHELTHILFVAHLPSTQPDIITSWEHDGFEWLATDVLLNRPVPHNADPYYIDVMEWLSSRSAS